MRPHSGKEMDMRLILLGIKDYEKHLYFHHDASRHCGCY